MHDTRECDGFSLRVNRVFRGKKFSRVVRKFMRGKKAFVKLTSGIIGHPDVYRRAITIGIRTAGATLVRMRRSSRTIYANSRPPLIESRLLMSNKEPRLRYAVLFNCVKRDA